ncbi:MAG TPA: hypothetical protein VMC09_12145 [Anaerolineales bacterium]|nr:hypothetical protein [Anaerolineales bacterium]
MYRGDRGLFWLGDPKLLFVTAPAPDAASVCQRWGYPGTAVIAPVHPTHQLSLDILREPALLERILEYAGSGRTLRMVPYATTSEFLQLADILQTRHGLTIHLPESPAPDRLWLRDYADTKAGFRAIASQCIFTPNIFPPGFVCKTISQAAGAVDWFLERGQDCVVKADSGESGIGHTIFSPQSAAGQGVLQALEKNPFLHNDNIIVEQFIKSSENLSPSLEMYVPPLSAGSPHITYVSQQLFSSFGRFAGVLVSRSLEKASWYPLLAERGMKIAETLQKMGYVGHFDLDAVVDDEGSLYLLETNARRTGGTYVHEFASFTFGPDYLDKVALLSINALKSCGITCLARLLDWLSDLLYPIQSTCHGVVVTVTSSLSAGEFGCILVGRNEAEVLDLHQALLDRLQDCPAEANPR